MKCQYLSCSIFLSAVAVTGCGWVDSSGRQENQAPGLSELKQVVWEQRDSVSLGNADLDNNLVDVTYELRAEGGSLIAACMEEVGAFEGVVRSDFAASLSEACDPEEGAELCSIVLEPNVAASELLVVRVPKLRRPVAQQYQITLQDNDGAKTEQLLTLCLATESTAPVAKADEYEVEYGVSRTVEGAEFNEDCGFSLASGVLGNDEDDFDFSEDDPNDQRCLVAKLVSPPAGHVGEFVLESNGGFNYVSSGALAIGQVDTFKYKAFDGLNNSGAVTVSVKITGENTPPEVLNPSAVIKEDSEGWTFGMADLATDPEGSVVKLVSVNGGERDVALGRVTFDSSPGKIQYIPRADANSEEPDVFSYVVEDAGGMRATGEASVTVTGVNDAPVVVPVEEQEVVFEVAVDVQGSLYFNVSDVDLSEGEVLNVTAESDNTDVLVVDQVIESTEEPGRWQVDYSSIANGEASIVVVAEDAAPSQGTSTTDFTVGDGVQSYAPVLREDALSVGPEKTVTWSIAADGLATDRDSAVEDLVFLALPTASAGTVEMAADNKSISYTAPADGDVTIEVSIGDDDGNSVQGVLNVTVQKAPVLSTDELSAVATLPSTWSIEVDALATDEDSASSDLVFVGVPTSGDGDVALGADSKSFTFTPDQAGPATLSVEIMDPEGNAVTGELNVNVTQQASPVLTEVHLSATQGQEVVWTISGDSLASDADTAVSELTFSSPPTSAGGVVALEQDEKGFSFIPSASGEVLIAVVITDPDGNEGEGNLIVDVTAAALP